MALLRRLAPVLACLALAACTLTTNGAPGVQVTPVATITTPHRGPVIVQYCADDTGSYPRGDFQGANALLAKSLPPAVIPNSEGLILYATLISSDTFDPSNTLAPFLIPAIPAYPPLPLPPTPTNNNPVTYSATATALASQQGPAITAYNAQVAAITAQVDSTRNQVTADTKRLTSWNPPIDSRATSVWGCLQLARQRFASHPGAKYLIIASDMQNNTDVDFTADFRSSQALKGVNVQVIFYYCQTAGACESLASSWQHIFITSGASSVQFNDPAQSKTLPNLFGGA
jgi:hypothetical protein